MLWKEKNKQLHFFLIINKQLQLATLLELKSIYPKKILSNILLKKIPKSSLQKSVSTTIMKSMLSCQSPIGFKTRILIVELGCKISLLVYVPSTSAVRQMLNQTQISNQDFVVLFMESELRLWMVGYFSSFAHKRSEWKTKRSFNGSLTYMQRIRLDQLYIYKHHQNACTQKKRKRKKK